MLVGTIHCKGAGWVEVEVPSMVDMTAQGGGYPTLLLMRSTIATGKLTPGAIATIELGDGEDAVRNKLVVNSMDWEDEPFADGDYVNLGGTYVLAA